MGEDQKETAMSVNLDIDRSADEIEDSHETEPDTLNDKEPEFVSDADSSDEPHEERQYQREQDRSYAPL